MTDELPYAWSNLYFVDPRQAPGPAREPLPAAHVQRVGPQVQSKQSQSRIAHCAKVANMRTLQQPHLVFSVQRVGLQVQSKRFRSRIAQAVTPVMIYMCLLSPATIFYLWTVV